MKKGCIAVLMAVFTSTVAGAADIVPLKSKMGYVTMNHKAHGELAKCDVCHGSGHAR